MSFSNIQTCSPSTSSSSAYSVFGSLIQFMGMVSVSLAVLGAAHSYRRLMKSVASHTPPLLVVNEGVAYTKMGGRTKKKLIVDSNVFSPLIVVILLLLLMLDVMKSATKSGPPSLMVDEGVSCSKKSGKTKKKNSGNVVKSIMGPKRKEIEVNKVKEVGSKLMRTEEEDVLVALGLPKGIKLLVRRKLKIW